MTHIIVFFRNKEQQELPNETLRNVSLENKNEKSPDSFATISYSPKTGFEQSARVFQLDKVS